MKVKIIVLETMFNEKLASEYAAPGLGKCPLHNVGEVFISEGGNKPEKLCDDAWISISRFAFAMAHGVEVFWPGWIEKKNITIMSCPDGFRQVVFKLETIE